MRDEIFEILKRITSKEVDADKGRPGMDLWKILVLGTLRLNCNWDFDKLHNIANEHKTVREFLGHTIFEFDQQYGLQTIKDNISLLSPQLLDEINQVAVTAGLVLPNGGNIGIFSKSSKNSSIMYAGSNTRHPKISK